MRFLSSFLYNSWKEPKNETLLMDEKYEGDRVKTLNVLYSDRKEGVLG